MNEDDPDRRKELYKVVADCQNPKYIGKCYSDEWNFFNGNFNQHNMR